MKFLLQMSLLLGTAAVFVLAGEEQKETENVEKFIQQEIDKSNSHVIKRSSPFQKVPELASFTQVEPKGKPDKISVTIFKEYKVQKPEGGFEFVGVQDDGVNGNTNLPQVQDFIQQQIASKREDQQQQSQENFQIHKSRDVAFNLEEAVPQVPQQIIPQQTRSLFVPAPQPLTPVPTTHKRKSMDGWIPLFGSSYIGPGRKQNVQGQTFKNLYAQTHYSKGAYYSPHKVETLQEVAGSSAVPQVTDQDGIQIQKANLNFFTQDEVRGNDQNKNFIINAENVVVNKKPESEQGPNVSQIKAYGSTPQITALLRERFRKAQEPHPLNNQKFPAGGVSLRGLAQAIRNGAFSLENDVIPSSLSEKQTSELEIMIPHKFKMSKAYSNVRMQQAQASIHQPAVYGVPGGSSNGFRDYGDSVKYGGGSGEIPIQIVETQPMDGYGGLGVAGGSSLNELAAQLEFKLKQLVQQEVVSQTQQLLQQQQQYGVPGQNQQQQQQLQQPIGEYGPPKENQQVQNEYGVPGVQPGSPLESYGPAPEEGPGHVEESYGPGADGHVEHLPPPPAKPININIDFDTGFHGDPHFHVESDAGDQIQVHHGDEHYEHHDEYHEEGPNIKEEIKEKLTTLSKNLFYSALDFSRKYNPITFIEHVKKFPPVKFEVYDPPKSKGHHKGHKKGHKKRRH